MLLIPQSQCSNVCSISKTGSLLWFYTRLGNQKGNHQSCVLLCLHHIQHSTIIVLNRCLSQVLLSIERDIELKWCDLMSKVHRYPGRGCTDTGEKLYQGGEMFLFEVNRIESRGQIDLRVFHSLQTQGPATSRMHFLSFLLFWRRSFTNWWEVFRSFPGSLPERVVWSSVKSNRIPNHQRIPTFASDEIQAIWCNLDQFDIEVGPQKIGQR